MEIKFKTIIETLETFCDEHYQIKTFGWGEPSLISTEEIVYPLLWLNPSPSNNSGNLYTMNFEMLVLDLLDQDMANKLDVMNDTLLIGNDVVSNFWDNWEDYDFTLNQNGVIVSPYLNGYSDHFDAGWIFDISIEIENRLNSCSVPKS